MTRRSRGELPLTGSRLALCFFLFAAFLSLETYAFAPDGRVPAGRSVHATSSVPSSTILCMAKKSSKKKGGGKKKSGGGAGGGGLKGFGSSTATATTKESAGTIDRSKDALAFYDYLEKNGGGDNLKRVALATFPLVGIKGPDGKDIQIRGVMATRSIKKGEAIIDVPYELAINLGRESSDPTLPATTLLQEYCRWISNSEDADGGTAQRKRENGAYFNMLPPYLGSDCLGSTDFFSDEALDALQFPPIKDETLRRRQLTSARYERDIEPMTQISSNMYRWEGGNEAVTEQHLRWAAWLITSRVLTVQGEEGTGEAFRLMIPLIDMCNHDRSSPHVLTGRAVSGGRLKILAGENIEAGSQVNIQYGGGVAGNDRFIQDYGFLDSLDGGTAYDMVANILMGGAAGGGNAAEFGRRAAMNLSDRTSALEALKVTSIEEDEAELDKATERDMREALTFRIGVKKALERLQNYT